MEGDDDDNYWLPRDGILHDYSRLPKDVIRNYLLPVYPHNPYYFSNRHILRMRHTCKAWKDVVDSYDVFWMFIQPVKTHTTYLISAMALVSQRHLKFVNQEQRNVKYRKTSIKGKITRKEAALERIREELEELKNDQEDLENDSRHLETEKEVVTTYRKTRKFKKVLD